MFLFCFFVLFCRLLSVFNRYLAGFCKFFRGVPPRKPQKNWEKPTKQFTQTYKTKQTTQQRHYLGRALVLFLFFVGGVGFVLIAWANLKQEGPGRQVYRQVRAGVKLIFSEFWSQSDHMAQRPNQLQHPLKDLFSKLSLICAHRPRHWAILAGDSARQKGRVIWPGTAYHGPFHMLTVGPHPIKEEANRKQKSKVVSSKFWLLDAGFPYFWPEDRIPRQRLCIEAMIFSLS